jgi:hypothetical protein
VQFPAATNHYPATASIPLVIPAATKAFSVSWRCSINNAHARRQTRPCGDAPYNTLEPEARVRVIAMPAAKAEVLEAIGKGWQVAESMQSVGRTVKTYEVWRKIDPDFKAGIERCRQQLALANERGSNAPDLANMSFPDFRKRFLDQDTYRHQQAWIDVLEGRDYTPLENEQYTPGKNRRRVLLNTPPFFAKTSTLTVEYSLYRICMNPDVRIILVSKTQAQAKKFLYAIKKRLTDRRWFALQDAFAPTGGFRGTGEWSQNKIYVGGGASGEKDPTVEALGIGGQIYGARADLIILDDVADVGNAHEFEKQIDWLAQDVASRLFDGILLVVGTRVGQQDIYSELMNGERYLSGSSPWTHLAQPAVLQFADDPVDWVTLWPRSSKPLDTESDELPGCDGTYPAWDGPRLSEIREDKKSKTWALVYQQQSGVGEDATFTPLNVLSSVDRRRKPGPLVAGAWGHPRAGGEGMWTIASMDPAMTGDTFTIVGKVDRSDQKRWIEQAWVQGSPSPRYIRDLIKRVTVEYGVNEWVIEKNAFQLFLTMDPEITTFLASRGVKITPHYTSNNKSDPDFGVASVAALFGTSRRINEGAGREVHNKDNLIDLPDQSMSQGIKTLIEELMLWVPGKRGTQLRQDGPMALWFFELRARQILGFDRDRPAATHQAIPFMSRGRARLRATNPMPFHGLKVG